MSTPSAAGTRHARKNAVRTFNKYVLNPVMVRLAGRKHWYASAIRHSGRRSGKSYVTPVVADRAGDRFVIPLPYGRRVDWLQNVLASGQAEIKSRGRAYPVTRPEIVDAAVAFPLVPKRHSCTWRRLGIDEYLLLTIGEG